MKIEYDKFGTKNIVCDNWGEFFNQFKSWHAKNKGIVPSEHYHNEDKFDLYVGYDGEGYGDFWERDEKGRFHAGFSRESFLNNGEVYAVQTVLGTYHKVGSPVNELAVLVLNLKVKYNDWKKQEEKAGKVLREIWTTGAAKSTHGLDLNWPKASQSKQLPEEENTPKLPNKGININSLIQYFQSQNIKRIELTPEGNLLIEYYYISPDKNNSTQSKIIVSERGINDNSELHGLRGVKSYLQKTNKKELSQQELNAMINANSTSTAKPKNNNALWMGGIAIALVIGVMVGFLVKNRVKKNK